MSERHDFGSKFYNTNLRKILAKELLSFFGRIFQKKTKVSKNYLNLGAGSEQAYLNDKFLNCDFFSLNYFNIFKKKEIFYLDLRHKLPFYDNSFEGVFSEHTIEHLYPSECIELMLEVKRVLKKNGVFRIVVPDLKKYIEYYNTKNFELFNKNFKTGCEAIWNISQNFDHKSLWDAEWLMHNLKKAGFSNCNEYSFNKGELKDLLIDRDGRQIESIYIEAKK